MPSERLLKFHWKANWHEPLSERPKAQCTRNIISWMPLPPFAIKFSCRWTKKFSISALPESCYVNGTSVVRLCVEREGFFYLMPDMLGMTFVKACHLETDTWFEKKFWGLSDFFYLKCCRCQLWSFLLQPCLVGLVWKALKVEATSCVLHFAGLVFHKVVRSHWKAKKAISISERI